MHREPLTMHAGEYQYSVQPCRPPLHKSYSPPLVWSVSQAVFIFFLFSMRLSPFSFQGGCFASVAWQKADIKVIPSNHTSGKSYFFWMFHGVFPLLALFFFLLRSPKKPGNFKRLSKAFFTFCLFF